MLRLTSAADDGRNDVEWTSVAEAFENELLAFHALVVDGTSPAAGLIEGRADIVTCQRAVRAIAGRTGTPIGGEAAV